MRVKKLQDQDRSVLLIVHDETGAAHNIIEALCNLLHDIVNSPPPCTNCGGEGNITVADDNDLAYTAKEMTCPACKGLKYDNLLQRYGLHE